MKTLLVFLLLTLSLFADRYDHDDGYRHKFHLPRDLHGLDLTKEQKRKIKTLLKEYHMLKRVHEAEEDEFEEVLEEDFLEEKFDEEKFIQLKSDLYMNAIKAEAKILKKIHNILDLKQRKKFSRYLEEWEIE